MPSTTHILQTLDDRMNPIVVKELRQWVTGHALSTMLILFLLAQLAILGVLSFHDFFADRDHTGRHALTALFWLSLIVNGFILPSFTQSRIKQELKEDQSDLMIVAVGAGKYLRGKIVAALIFSTMVYTTAAPLAVMTVLMRGVDPPTVLTLAALNAAAIVFMTVFPIMSECTQRHPLRRIVISLMTIPGFAIIPFGAIIFLPRILDQGPDWLANADTLAGITTLGMVLACIAGICYIVAAASLDPLPAAPAPLTDLEFSRGLSGGASPRIPKPKTRNLRPCPQTPSSKPSTTG